MRYTRSRPTVLKNAANGAFALANRRGAYGCSTASSPAESLVAGVEGAEPAPSVSLTHQVPPHPATGRTSPRTSKNSFCLMAVASCPGPARPSASAGLRLGKDENCTVFYTTPPLDERKVPYSLDRSRSGLLEPTLHAMGQSSRIPPAPGRFHVAIDGGGNRSHCLAGSLPRPQ